MKEVEEDEESDEEDEEKWGLPAAPTAGSKTRYVALAVVALALAGGGYLGYTRYWPKSGESTEELVASADDEEKKDGSTRDVALDADPFSTPEVDPQKGAANQKPRIARHTQDAAPISTADASRGKPRSTKPSDSSSEIELPLEIPSEEEGETTELGALQQDEPDEELESEMPLLAAPKSSGRNLAAAGTGARRAAAAEEIPLNDEDENDPYTIDEDHVASPAGKKPPAISFVDVKDEEAEREAPAAPSPQRAVSKTVVVRSAAAATAPSAPEAPEDDDAWTIDDEPRTSRKPAVDLTDEIADDDGEVSAIRPKGAAVTPGRKTGSSSIMSESSTRSGVARAPAGSATDAKGEIYTIAPNDNFWTISRRQYGSGRYFAALARHNQDRVSDPQRLRPGMKISTPSASVLESTYPELIDKSAPAAAPASRAASGGAIAGDGRPLFTRPSASQPPADSPAPTAQQVGYFYSKSGEPMYRVGEDDTLGSIAQKHLGRASRWTEIFEQNRETLKNPENLTVGTIIRLPPDASKVGWLDSEPKSRR